MKPIVIFDGDDYTSGRKSSIKTYGLKQKEEDHQSRLKEKPYAFKYRVVKIRCGEYIDFWDCNQIDLSQFTLVNLKIHGPDDYQFKSAMVN